MVRVRHLKSAFLIVGICISCLPVQVTAKAWKYAYLDNGYKLLQLGYMEEAYQFFDSAVVKNPNDSIALVSRGSCLYRLERFDEAITDLSRALQIGFDSEYSKSYKASCLLYLGHSFLKKNDMKKAMDSFEQCFAVYPKMLSDYSNVPANSQVQIDQLNDVRIAYNFATPSRREYAITGYKTHESLKRLTDKFKLCKKSLETSVKKASDGDLTGSVEDLTKIAEINLQGDILEARNFLEKWKKLDLQEEIYTKLQSSLDKLTQTGTLAIKQTSASLAARALTAVQPQLALQTAENLRRMNGFNELGQYYSFCSSANLELNDLNAAQESALKSLKEKEDVDTRVLLSEIYEAKKLYPEAIEIYEKLTVAVPESERWYGLFHLARLYALAGQIAKAKELGSKADQSFDLDKSTGPKNDYAWVSGRYYAAIGDYAEALVKLSEAIAYMRKFDWFKSACAQLDRAYCYSKLGKAKQAEIDVKQVEKYFLESPYLSAKAQSVLNNPLLSESKPLQEKWALIIGISNFADEKIPTLRYSAKDAADIQHFLVEEAGFKPDHVHLLTNKDATRQRILEELADKWLPLQAKPDDAVLIFISTHGTPAAKDLGALNYIVAHDTMREHLFTTGIPMQQIMNLIHDRLKSSHALLLTDTCYSGGTANSGSSSTFGNLEASNLINGAGQLIMCSSSPNQRSWESTRYQNGVFTGQLLRLMEGNKISDFKIDLFEKLQKQVSAEVKEDFKTEQNPQLVGKWNASEVFQKKQK